MRSRFASTPLPRNLKLLAQALTDGAAEARARIPAGLGLVGTVIALHDVAKSLARAGGVKPGVHESEPRPLGLVQSRDEPRPQGCDCAGAADDHRGAIDQNPVTGLAVA